MKVQVTQEDIDKGIRGNCTNCPVALAVARTLNAKVIDVDENEMVVHPTDSSVPLSVVRHIYSTPHEAKQFIVRFDQDGPSVVAPFDFELAPFEFELAYELA